MSLIRLVLQSIEETILKSLAPLSAPVFASVPDSHRSSLIDDVWSSLRDPFILMAAPKSRKSAYTVRQRRRAPSKLIPRRPDLEPCSVCGNTKIKFYLCTHCYTRIMQETREIQAKMAEVYSNPLKAITEEVTLLYDEIQKSTDNREKLSGNDEKTSGSNDETVLQDDQASSNEISIRMQKKRPSWFF